jgi:hypothetical protein
VLVVDDNIMCREGFKVAARLAGTVHLTPSYTIMHLIHLLIHMPHVLFQCRTGRVQKGSGSRKWTGINSTIYQ